MKRAVFEIKQNAVGRYYFVFKEDNEQALVVSGSFWGRSELEKRLANVREAAPVACICDDRKSNMPPLFELHEGKDGLAFSLVGFDGKLIFDSKAYKEKSGCLEAIETLKRESFNAGIVDSVN